MERSTCFSPSNSTGEAITGLKTHPISIFPVRARHRTSWPPWSRRSPALAAGDYHRLLGSLGATPHPTLIAVDNSGSPSEGDIYVYDVVSDKIYKFDASGNLITNWGNEGHLRRDPAFMSTGWQLVPREPST